MQVYTTILAGGKGLRVFNLTKGRAKPSVRFAGYNLLEMMINLCENAGHKRIEVYTEYLTDSMKDTVRAWDMEFKGSTGWVRDYPTQGAELEGNTRGSADALVELRPRRRTLVYEYDIRDDDVFTVLSADHVTNLDLSMMVDAHRLGGHDITLAVARVRRELAAGEMGVVTLDEKGNVVRFQEKPPLDAIESIPCDPGYCYANTANIAYRPNALEESLDRFFDRSQDKFDQSKHLLTPLVEEGKMKIRAFIHTGYWSDVGQLDALFDANMDLVDVDPKIDLYHMIARTQSAFRSPGAPYSGQGVKITPLATFNGIAENGTIVSGNVQHSVLSYGVRVEHKANVSSAVLFDRVYVGGDATIRESIIDKNSTIGAGAVIDPSRVREGAEGYRWMRIGEKKDHLLIQKSFDGSVIPLDRNGMYIPEEEMMPIRDEQHGQYFEAVLTPRKRLVVSKFSFLPDGFVFGE